MLNQTNKCKNITSQSSKMIFKHWNSRMVKVHLLETTHTIYYWFYQGSKYYRPKNYIFTLSNNIGTLLLHLVVYFNSYQLTKERKLPNIFKYCIVLANFFSEFRQRLVPINRHIVDVTHCHPSLFNTNNYAKPITA